MGPLFPNQNDNSIVRDAQLHDFIKDFANVRLANSWAYRDPLATRGFGS